MSKYELIMNVLQGIDSDAAFAVRSEAELIPLFRNSLHDDNENLEELALAEFYAFMAIENYRGPGTWKSYFGSPLAQSIKGETEERIPIGKITPEIISYWKKRLTEVSHPILKARYAGLVWELEFKICGTKPSYQEVAVVYIDNLLLSVTNSNITGFPASRIKLNRALSLAVSMKNENLKKAGINAVLHFQNTRATESGAGTWRASYDLLVVPGIVTKGDPNYDLVMATLEKWFNEATNPKSDRVDLSAAEAVFEPLFDQYKVTGDDSNLRSALERMQALIDRKVQTASAAEAMHWLEKMKYYYQKAKDQLSFDRITVRLQELGPRLITEMKKIGTEQTFPKDRIDQFIEGLFALPIDRIYFTIPASFIPDLDEASKGNGKTRIHLSDMFSTSTYSHDGRKVATIGSVEEDEKGRSIREAQLQITMSTIFLHFVFAAGRERNILTVESFMDFVKQSDVISANRYSIIQRAFEAWIDKDYLVFIHLIIPQIEAVCLQVVKNSDSPIQKENRHGGYNVLVMGDLLRETSLVQTLGTSGVNYFTALFSDPRGLNLRNEVAHGLRDSEGFDESAANVTMIGLLHLIASTINIS